MRNRRRQLCCFHLLRLSTDIRLTRGAILNAHEQLRSIGQSLWLGHVSRKQLCNEILMRYVDDGILTGLVLSLRAINHSMSRSSVYDDAIRARLNEELYGEPLLTDLILDDTQQAADRLLHLFDRSEGVEGWVAVPVSPLQANTPDTLLESVSALRGRLQRKNVLITVPGCPKLFNAIEELVYAGIPLHITLVYSSSQFASVAEAYLQGVNRRLAAGLKPAVSAFTSIPLLQLASQLGKATSGAGSSRAVLAVARKIYASMCDLNHSPLFEHLFETDARPLRLIWSCSDHEPAKDAMCSLHDHLAAPFTVAQMSEQVMAEYCRCGHPAEPMPKDGGDAEQVLADFGKTGLDPEKLADIFQENAVEHQEKEWITILDTVARKSTEIIQMKQRHHQLNTPMICM